MLSRKRLTAVITCSILSLGASAQEQKYPQGYFRNPLDIPISLAGNYGECRPGHFHAGLDIKTNGVENQAVYAAADGYISRIKMQTGGYGHALYITHPNGYTTLYGHLNNFAPELQAYLRSQQYKQRSWTVDLPLSPDQFPVKKGQQIAWSGNTGASLAPHLHFEIRDSKNENPLNGSLFGFDITDTKPPTLYKLAVYDLNQSVYQQQPNILALQKKGNTYQTAVDTIRLSTNSAGIGIYTNDYMDGSTNTLGLYTASLTIDGKEVSAVQLDDIGFDETRYLHAYADYRMKMKNGYWLQCLFKLPGNHLNHIYKLQNGNGSVDLSDGRGHVAQLKVSDAFGNTSTADFILQGKPGSGTDSCLNMLKANSPNIFEDINISYTLSDDALYDKVCLDLKNEASDKHYSGIYTINDVYIPIHKYYRVRIKPDKPIPFNLRHKIVMQHTEDGSRSASAARYEDNGWYSSATRNFGTYWLDADTVAPVIKSLNGTAAISKTRHLKFKVTDETTSVDKFEAMLDGKWLLFEPAGSTYTYHLDDHCAPGKHTLKISATDENNNTATFTYSFIR